MAEIFGEAQIANITPATFWQQDQEFKDLQLKVLD